MSDESDDTAATLARMSSVLKTIAGAVEPLVAKCDDAMVKLRRLREQQEGIAGDAHDRLKARYGETGISDEVFNANLAAARGFEQVEYERERLLETFKRLAESVKQPWDDLPPTE